MVSLIIDFFKRMKFPIIMVVLFGIYQFIKLINQGYWYSALASFFGAIFGGGLVLVIIYFSTPSKK